MTDDTYVLHKPHTWEDEVKILMNSINFTLEDLWDVGKDETASTVRHKVDIIDLLCDLQRMMISSIRSEEREAVSKKYDDPNFWEHLKMKSRKWGEKLRRQKEMDKIFDEHLKVLEEIYKEERHG